MTIRVALHHRTEYHYDRPIQLNPHIVRLRPAPHARTPIVSYSQTVKPAQHFVNWQQDPFGNYLARLVFPEKADVLSVTIDLVVDLVAVNPFDFFLEENAFHAPFSYLPDERADLAPYLETAITGDLFDDLVFEVRKRWRDAEPETLRTVDFLVETNQILERRIEYTVRMEPGVQTPEETLSLARGSCRDSAWLLVSLLRRVGIAARFVSGYLIQLAPDERPVDGPGGPLADFTDLHAWAEAYIPGAGWIGLDPTSGLFAGEGHIPLAATPTPQSAAPISGSLEAAEVDFDFAMSVTRVREPARITKPLTEAHWSALDAAGEAVEARLRSDGVNLMMGGEPTFVSSSDRDSEEWTIDAVGPTKRHYADRLSRRLQARLAPGGVLTHVQGKWYPGEQLPRWAFGLYWRRDQEPLWSDPALLSTEHPALLPASDTAQILAETLAAELGLDPDYVQPVFEDPAEFLLAEHRLPNNLTPDNNKLDDPLERTRLSRIFDQGLTNPVGFVLPVQQAQSLATAGRDFAWLSELWTTRRGRIFLTPGDSPAGLRLPLRGLPYLTQNVYPHIFELDPFAPRGPLPRVRLRHQERPRPKAWQRPERQPTLSADGTIIRPSSDKPPREGDQNWSVRTALTVEQREGQLYIFMPPVETADAWVDMVGAIERSAAALGQPVRLEGYPAPTDPRLNMIKITPDPGVIEVNIHPSASWSDLKTTTYALYDEAKHCGLDASTFMVDGRPLGSGGGAHITLGGRTAGESPFLRRPDLLASLIRFWQNHPSLSYFFSGLFIGPTSQAPRVDEAREGLLYELEIALRQLSAASDIPTPPWIADRVLRHLLVDVTGNTHRAEICIDKLFSPDSATGRLGIVEFRAFEMPPHARMNLAQQLVLRALVAWFWREPYRAPLRRFGTALHDRFMLPTVLWTDFCEVLALVSEGIGHPLDPAWFEAQRDFRFPFIGEMSDAGITVSLRNALEPWHVLGEEQGAGGTARFVDSSLERIEVKVTGAFDPAVHAIACNQRPLPLQKTERRDEWIAGVRFRTWWPSHCLHPLIAPHAPLTFDLVQRAEERAIVGCRYQSVHPGGFNFETRPINALEAEGRRLARFESGGHSPGRIVLQPEQPNPEYPYTLDLRF
ncbi:MAG: transglutaminase family protein [Pseudomonadota bacterium]